VAATPAARVAASSAPTVPGAEQTFAEVLRLIETQYVDSGLSRDQLWSGAIEGMLDRLVKTPGIKVNTLLDPARLSEMKAGLKGSFSGIGVVIKKFGEVVFVAEVLPGGPADRAGLRKDDRMLEIDGKTVKGLDISQMVQRIRGPGGTTVKLFVQRETREWTLPVVRGQVTLDAVSGALLPPSVGYIRITSFKETSLPQLDQLVDRLTRQGARAMVLDLRGCPGGLLDVSIGVADRFLPPGQRVVSIRRRDGREQVHTARADNPADRLPVIVLVGKGTASGAEIVAAALADNDRATVIGQRTLGKGTVEEILQLGNSWALKLSVARFYSPRGQALQGRGVVPDFAVVADGAAARSYFAAPDPAALARDPQVTAALEVLRLGKR